ncbi:MAG: glycosyltransferase family 4 protein [Candidatus Latescibacteria bacterium]|nr:glycosyltransferase family 4 protein [Candidatus Latescibacterota bacterium]
MRFGVFSSDPLYKYHQKGEIKARYWNPEEMFDEVCVFSFCDEDIEPEKVQALVGRARLRIVPLGPPSALGLAGQRRRAVEVLQAWQPDLVRVHNPWHAGVVGLGAARKVGAPALLSLHTHYAARRRWERRWLLHLLRPFERYSVRRADCVLCVSEYLTGYAREQGARRVEVIYNRVYAEQFASPPRQRSGRPIILSVGRLDPPKDQACLIRALRGLDAELVLVGDGVNRAALEALARAEGVGERVVFTGAVPHAQIQAQYARADLFAMATHYEGFCIPVLEAMAAGLPVVACNTEPLPEILGGTGRCVPHDPGSFHQALAQLIADPPAARALGQAARTRALQLDGSRMEEREAELYRDLIQRGRSDLPLR